MAFAAITSSRDYNLHRDSLQMMLTEIGDQPPTLDEIALGRSLTSAMERYPEPDDWQTTRDVLMDTAKARIKLGLGVTSGHFETFNDEFWRSEMGVERQTLKLDRTGSGGLRKKETITRPPPPKRPASSLQPKRVAKDRRIEPLTRLADTVQNASEQDGLPNDRVRFVAEPKGKTHIHIHTRRCSYH